MTNGSVVSIRDVLWHFAAYSYNIEGMGNTPAGFATIPFSLQKRPSSAFDVSELAIGYAPLFKSTVSCFANLAAWDLVMYEGSDQGMTSWLMKVAEPEANRVLGRHLGSIVAK